MRIAIITFEYEGLTHNGGVGTAYARLADLLSSHGHAIEVFLIPYGNALTSPKNRLKPKLESLQQRGISVTLLEKKGFTHSSLFDVERAMLTYRTIIKQTSYDVIHFPDTGGLAFFLLRSKVAGFSFKNTSFVCGAHGPSRWVDEINRIPASRSKEVEELERFCVQNADWLVSPSQYMLDYLRTHHWLLPRQALIIPNVNCLETFKVNRRQGVSRTVIFFGRQEERKGLRVFLKALPHTTQVDTAIILGKKPAHQRGQSDLSQLIKRTKNLFSGILKVYEDLPSELACATISSIPGALVCIPSQIENSPYTIVEAVENQWKLLASTTGGTKELISAPDLKRVHLASNPKLFARQMDYSVTHTFQPICPSKKAKLANQLWLKFHQRIQNRADQIFQTK